MWVTHKLLRPVSSSRARYSQEVKWSQSETSIRAGFFSACSIAEMSVGLLEIMWNGLGVPGAGLTRQFVFDLKDEIDVYVLDVY